jgi:hypothetical protein
LGCQVFWGIIMEVVDFVTSGIPEENTFEVDDDNIVSFQCHCYLCNAHTLFALLLSYKALELKVCVFIEN